MNVEILEDPQAVAERAAERTVKCAKEAIKARGRFILALSGGSSPQRFHQVLRDKHGASIDWSKVHVLFSDDRAVGPEHEHSNYRMARETLLEGSAIPPENIHRIEADDGDAERAARAYEAVLARVAQNVVDMLILGMGADGHTASLFPGAVQPEGLVVHTKAPPPNPIEDRVTFSYEALRRGREAIVIVLSQGKAKRLQEVLETEGDLPMQRVCKERSGDITFIVDQEAGRLLTRSRQ